MGLAPVHGDAERGDALVAADGDHVGGLAHDHRRRARDLGGDLGDQVRRAQAADLLVIGKGQVRRPLQRGGGQGRRRRQGQGQEPLHVAGPPPIEPLALARQGEGIAGPGLAVHGHHVGMARQHHPALDRRSDGGQQVGLGPFGIDDPARGHADPGQFALHIGDQVEVRPAGGGVEGHQPGQVFGGACGESLVVHDPRLASPPPPPKEIAPNLA